MMRFEKRSLKGCRCRIRSIDGSIPNCKTRSARLSRGLATQLAVVQATAASSPRVALGMSGGVDSTVAAILLQNQGYEVYGVFMKNWDVEEAGTGTSSSSPQSCSERDWIKVQEICRKLNIPAIHMNFTKDYWISVFDPFVSALATGLQTPNPDVACNTNIKFGAFYDRAVRELGADYIAFGHYARVVPPSLPFLSARLFRAKDKVKDQTYFLSSIPSAALNKTLFPLANLLKSKVKEIATLHGFSSIAKQKESMGLCFIGKQKNFGHFLTHYLPPSSPSPPPSSTSASSLLSHKKNSKHTKHPHHHHNQALTEKGGSGFFITPSNQILGSHPGLPFLTIGQKARIPGAKTSYYVCHKDARSGNVVVVPSRHHPALEMNSVEVCEVGFFGAGERALRKSKRWSRWRSSLDEDTEDAGVGGDKDKVLYVKLRHVDGLVELKSVEFTSCPLGQPIIRVFFVRPVGRVATGQQVAFYIGDECVAGGKVAF